MRCMIMHKTNAHWEAGAIPSPELIARVGAMIGEMDRAGALLAAEGLRASSQGVRLDFLAGTRVATPGPFVGSNELIAGFAILRVRSLEEAVQWASSFAAIIGDTQIDIRPVTEPWDIGAAPKPAGVTTRRYMLMRKADRNTEAGVALTRQQSTDMSRLIDELTRSGTLLSSEMLEPSSKAMRCMFAAGQQLAIDGPFPETKELVGGFVIIEAESMQEAFSWGLRYTKAVGDVELDLRPLSDRHHL